MHDPTNKPKSTSTPRASAPSSSDGSVDREAWQRIVAGVPLVEFLPVIASSLEHNDELIGLAREYAYDSIDTSPRAAERKVIMPLFAAMAAAGHPEIAHHIKERGYSQIENLELHNAIHDRHRFSPFALAKIGTLEAAFANTGEVLLNCGLASQAIPLLTLALTIYHFNPIEAPVCTT